MKLLPFIFILFAIDGDAQMQANANINTNYKGIEGLFLISSLDSSLIITTFKCGRGFEGVVLEIKVDGKFKESIFGCDGREPIDSGTWKIFDNKLLFGKLSCELFRFESLYYLIERSQKEKFIKDFHRAINEAKRDSSIELSYEGKVLWAVRNDYFMK